MRMCESGHKTYKVAFNVFSALCIYVCGVFKVNAVMFAKIKLAFQGLEMMATDLECDGTTFCLLPKSHLIHILVYASQSNTQWRCQHFHIAEHVVGEFIGCFNFPQFVPRMSLFNNLGLALASSKLLIINCVSDYIWTSILTVYVWFWRKAPHQAGHPSSVCYSWWLIEW